MIEQVADANGETVSYSYRPSVFGAFREFSLTEQGIAWAVGLLSGSIPLDRGRRLPPPRWSGPALAGVLAAAQHAVAPFRDRAVGRRVSEAADQLELMEKHDGTGAALGRLFLVRQGIALASLRGP